MQFLHQHRHMRITFKYNYTLLENGIIRTFKAGESVDFPADSPMIETFRIQNGDVLIIHDEKKIKGKKGKKK